MNDETMVSQWPALLGISCELRLLILGYLLKPGVLDFGSISRDEISDASSPTEYPPSPDSLPDQGLLHGVRVKSLFLPDVSILRVCRKIHNEGTAVLYGENEFRFGSKGIILDACYTLDQVTELARWTQGIGEQNSQLLRNVTILLPDWTYNDYLVSNQEMPRKTWPYADVDITLLLGFLCMHLDCRVQFRFDLRQWKATVTRGWRTLSDAISPRVFNPDRLTIMLRKLQEKKKLVSEPNCSGCTFNVSTDGLTGLVLSDRSPRHNNWTKQFALAGPSTNLQEIRQRWAERDFNRRGLDRPLPEIKEGDGPFRDELISAKPSAPELLTLPSSILSKIYQYALGTPKNVIIMHEPNVHLGAPLPRQVAQDLEPFKGNYLMFKQAKSLYFSLNTFVFHWSLGDRWTADINQALPWVSYFMLRFERNSLFDSNRAWSSRVRSVGSGTGSHLHSNPGSGSGSQLYSNPGSGTGSYVHSNPGSRTGSHLYSNPGSDTGSHLYPSLGSEAGSYPHSSTGSDTGSYPHSGTESDPEPSMGADINSEPTYEPDFDLGSDPGYDSELEVLAEITPTMQLANVNIILQGTGETFSKPLDEWRLAVDIRVLRTLRERVLPSKTRESNVTITFKRSSTPTPTPADLVEDTRQEFTVTPEQIGASIMSAAAKRLAYTLFENDRNEYVYLVDGYGRARAMVLDSHGSAIWDHASKDRLNQVLTFEDDE